MRTTRWARSRMSPPSPRSRASAASRCTWTRCRRPAGSPSSGLGADAISIAGHKIGAPKGTGALVVRGRIPLEPLMHGGGQERGRRSGTEHVAGAVALATALDLAEAEREEASARVARLARRLHRPRARPRAERGADGTSRCTGCRAPRASPSRARAARPCCSSWSAGASSPPAARRAPRAATSPRTCCVAMGIPAEVAQTAVRFTLAARVHALARARRRRGGRVGDRRTIDRMTRSPAAVTVIVPGSRRRGVRRGGAGFAARPDADRVDRDPRRRCVA